MRILVVAFAFALALAAAGCSDKPSKAECEKLLDHTIRLELSEAGTKISEEKVQALADTAREEFIEQCLDKVSAARIRCALKAQTKRDVLACDES